MFGIENSFKIQNTKYKYSYKIQKKCRNTIRMTFSDLFYHFNDHFLVHLLLYQGKVIKLNRKLFLRPHAYRG